MDSALQLEKHYRRADSTLGVIAFSIVPWAQQEMANLIEKMLPAKRSARVEMLATALDKFFPPEIRQQVNAAMGGGE